VGSNSPYPPVLAVNNAGSFVIAWYSNPQREASAANSGLAAATGNEDNLSSARIVTSSNVDAKTIQTGIDRTGDALVIWLSGTTGVNQTKLFVAVHRH
jgi:predicted nucleotide-binding protein